MDSRCTSWPPQARQGRMVWGSNSFMAMNIAVLATCFNPRPPHPPAGTAPDGPKCSRCRAAYLSLKGEVTEKVFHRIARCVKKSFPPEGVVSDHKEIFDELSQEGKGVDVSLTGGVAR